MKQLKWIGLLALVLVLAACTQQEETTETEAIAGNQEETLDVGVAFFPMKEILELIEEDLASDGVTLAIHEFSDYQTPNNLLKDGELDANMIQHDYFLQSFNEANDTDLITILPMYHAIYALYAKDVETVDEIPEGTAITLPDDATNRSRALYLLGQAGLLTFTDGKTTGLTPEDIEENPKNLDFYDQVPLTSLAQRYTETGFAVMYPTYAQSLALEGDEERIFTEEQDEVTKDYAISLVSRADNKDSAAVRALMEHLHSDKVKQFLIDEYGWASEPAW